MRRFKSCSRRTPAARPRSSGHFCPRHDGCRAVYPPKVLFWEGWRFILHLLQRDRSRAPLGQRSPDPERCEGISLGVLAGCQGRVGRPWAVHGVASA